MDQREKLVLNQMVDDERVDLESRSPELDLVHFTS